MNVHPLTQFKTLSALLVAGLLGLGHLLAADPPARERPADRGPGATGAPGGPAPASGGARGGVLEDKQREVIREAAQPLREQMRKLDEQLAAAQRELTKAMLAEQPEEKTIRAKAEAVAKIQVEQTMLRAKILAAVAPTLKPEQREQLLANPWLLNTLTGGGWMGGMRGGPGREAPPAR